MHLIDGSRIEDLAEINILKANMDAVLISGRRLECKCTDSAWVRCRFVVKAVHAAGERFHCSGLPKRVLNTW